MICSEETNRHPITQGDLANVNVGQTVVVNVLSNDFDPDGDPLTITSLLGSGNSVSSIVDNRVQITRTSRYGGVVYYNVSDGRGGTAQERIMLPSQIPGDL